MKKAIVLTHTENGSMTASVTDEEKKLLLNTDVYKIACNDYCADLKPDIRLCADNIVNKCLECDSVPVVSCNYDLNKSERVINGNWLPKRHTTLIHCIDYLLLNGYTHILLIATNPAERKDTYNLNLNGVNHLKRFVYLFKYSQDGNFDDIPYLSIKEFLNMTKLTDEEKILGIKEPAKRLFDVLSFTSDCYYEVHTKGLNNKSIENGKTIGSILPSEVKKDIESGAMEIEYNGLVIKRITGNKPVEKEVAEVKQEQTQVEEEPILEEAPKPKKTTTATKKKASKKK